MALRLKEVAEELSDIQWTTVKCMAVHLNQMSWGTLEKIESSSSVDDERINRAIDTWMRRDVDASWVQLVSALRIVKQNALAEKIRARYCPNMPADTQPAVETSSTGIDSDETAFLPSEPLAAQPHALPLVDTCLSSPPQTHGLISFNASNKPAKSPTPSSPVHVSSGLDQHPSNEPLKLSSTPALAVEPYDSMQGVARDVTISESRVKEIEEEMSHLDDRYADLRTNTHLYMIEKENESPTFLKTFRVTILELPQREQVRYPRLFQNTYEIHSAPNVSHIFDVIRPYSNYMNYELLQWIITKFGNPPLKQEMSGYVVELETFEMKTTIMEFVAATNDCTEIPDNYRRIIVKIRKDASQCTLHEVRMFVKKALVKKSCFMPHALMLEQISVNTVVVTLGVPCDSLAHLSLAFDTEFQEAHSICTAVIDGERLEVRSSL